MPVLKNPRHEAFAQALAEQKTADEAYVLAGYAPGRGNATRLKLNDSIQKRVAELLEKVARKTEVTVESLTAELEQARAIAIAENQAAAAVSATMSKAKLLGLDVNKNLNVNLNSNFHEHTDDELQFELASMLNEARALAGKPVVELPEPKKH